MFISYHFIYANKFVLNSFSTHYFYVQNNICWVVFVYCQLSKVIKWTYSTLRLYHKWSCLKPPLSSEFSPLKTYEGHQYIRLILYRLCIDDYTSLKSLSDLSPPLFHRFLTFPIHFSFTLHYFAWQSVWANCRLSLTQSGPPTLLSFCAFFHRDPHLSLLSSHCGGSKPGHLHNAVGV